MFEKLSRTFLLQIEQEKLDAYFDVLEKKEQMEQKMDSVRERECNVITCIKVKQLVKSEKLMSLSTCTIFPGEHSAVPL